MNNFVKALDMNGPAFIHLHQKFPSQCKED
jgi:pyruvate/2-oxoacid:ferredoxin oxidoreductase beta subunit